MANKALSLTIPCYNESKNLPYLLGELSKEIKRNDIEIVLVDNGSTDDTQDVLNQLLPDFSFVRCIRIKKNIGYGHGIFTGLKSSNGEFIGWTHGDLQTGAKDIVKALEILEQLPYKEKAYIKGCRVGRPVLDNVFSLGMGLFASLILRRWFFEINAQPNLFHRSMLLNLPTPPTDFSFDLFFYYMAKTLGYKIRRFDVVFKDRLFGVSDWNTDAHSRLRFIRRTALYTWSLRKRIRSYKQTQILEGHPGPKQN